MRVDISVTDIFDYEVHVTVKRDRTMTGLDKAALRLMVLAELEYQIGFARMDRFDTSNKTFFDVWISPVKAEEGWLHEIHMRLQPLDEGKVLV